MNGDKESVKIWKRIKDITEEINVLDDKTLWCSDQDLIATAKYFSINILNFKEKTSKQAAHWVCYSPGQRFNYNQKPEFPDMCIYCGGNHYQTITSISSL